MIVKIHSTQLKGLAAKALILTYVYDYLEFHNTNYVMQTILLGIDIWCLQHCLHEWNFSLRSNYQQLN